MKKKTGLCVFRTWIFGLVMGLSMFSFAHAATLNLNNFAATDLHFAYNGNSFSAKVFFKDLKQVSETVVLNGVRKSCTKQVRGYYFNPARGLRVWPLDQDSLDYLKTTDSSYNNLSLDGGLFVCSDSSMAIYGSLVHHWRFNSYYLIA